MGSLNWKRLQKQALRRHLQRANRGVGQPGRPGAAEGNRGTLRPTIRWTLRIALIPLFVVGLLIVSRVDFRSPAAKRYPEWDAAYRQRDASRIERILAPEFHLDTARGTQLSRDDYVKGLFQSIPRDGYYTQVEKIDGTEGDATALVAVTISGKDGKAHRYRYRDEWVERNGAWLLTERSRSWSEPHRR